MQKLARAIGVFVCLLVASSTFSADEALWKRVQRMDPGTRIAVTAGGTTSERYLVQLSDTDLIVLNLTAPDLPKRQLINMAIDNPAWMAGTEKTTYRDNNVRVGPDGVFVKDKKVAELNQVVERIPRDKVTAIQK
jgi:hypothetical protein